MTVVNFDIHIRRTLRRHSLFASDVPALLLRPHGIGSNAATYARAFHRESVVYHPSIPDRALRRRLLDCGGVVRDRWL